MQAVYDGASLIVVGVRTNYETCLLRVIKTGFYANRPYMLTDERRACLK